MNATLRRAADHPTILLFLVVSLGFFLLRGFYPPVLDDTTSILIADEVGPFAIRGPVPFWETSKSIFLQLHSSGYRPVSIMIAVFVGGLIALGELSFPVWTAVAAVPVGLTAVVTFLLGRRLSGSPWGGLIAAVLLLGCPPYVTAAWVLYAGIQTLVPLLIGCGVLLYLEIIERPGVNWRWAALGGILLVGPWVREFIAVLGPIIVAAEILRTRRITPAAVLGLAGFLHGLFPTVLIHFLFAPELSTAPVFRLGLLGNQIGVEKDPRFLKPEVAFYVLQLIPPSFLALITAALLLRDDAFRSKIDVALCAVIVGGAVIAFVGYAAGGGEAFLMTAVVLISAAPAVLALRTASVVAIWYAAAYLPFFKIFAQETHLAYTAQPLALIAATAVIGLHRRLPAGAGARGLRAASAAVAAVLCLDQCLNIIAGRRVTMAMTDAAVRLARYASVILPPGSVLGANVLTAQDVQLFSRGHVRVRFTFPGRDFEPAATAAAGEGRAVYLLAGEHPYPSAKATYHRNRYVDTGAVALEPMGRLLTVRVIHPYLDPLRAAADRPYVSFLGPPDLVNDVYAGPERGGRPFLREHYVAYDLYRVTDPTVDRERLRAVPSDEPLRLVESGYQGHNILSYNGYYYAVPQSLGAVNGPDLAAERYGATVLRDRLPDRLRRAADQPSDQGRSAALVALGVAAPTPIADVGPDGFTVFAADNGLIAVPVAALARPVGYDGYPQWFAAPDAETLARRIRAVTAPVDLAAMPWLTVWNPEDMTARPAPTLGDIIDRNDQTRGYR